VHDAVVHDVDALRGLGTGHLLYVGSREMVARLRQGRRLHETRGSYPDLPARGRPGNQISGLWSSSSSGGGGGRVNDWEALAGRVAIFGCSSSANCRVKAPCLRTTGRKQEENKSRVPGEEYGESGDNRS